MPVTIGNTGITLTCSEFYELRKALAKEAGIDLDKMEGYGLKFEGDQPVYSDTPISWDQIPDPSDPLVSLLNHSDIDGEFGVAVNLFCGERIREIAAAWPDSHLWKKTAHQLGSKMLEAGTIGERILLR